MNRQMNESENRKANDMTENEKKTETEGANDNMTEAKNTDKAKRAANALLTALALMVAKRSAHKDEDEQTVCFTVYLNRGKGETGPARVFKGRREGVVEIVEPDENPAEPETEG